jgi:DNA-binding beta-propeller fold protein YncE
MGGVAVAPGGRTFWVRWGAITILGLPQVPYGGICGSNPCWGVPGTGPGQFDRPYGLAVDPTGFVYVTDLNQRRVQKHTFDGSFVTQWGSSGSGPGQFTFPTGVAVAPNGDVYVTDFSRISQFTSAGTFLTSWGTSGSGPGQFSVPYGLALSGSGDLYVADSFNHRVQRFGNAPVAGVRSTWGRLKSIYR